MLEDFKEEQKIVYQILKNAILKNHSSHAYLFETNGYLKKDAFILSFVKALLCPNAYFNSKKCVNCTQCQNIDQNQFSEVIHIYPDGQWIKKEQMDALQKEFNKTSVQASKRIYVIHQAEKMNASAANSILKFLEEPEENIIAILLTDNMYQMLETIISRCQIISLSKVKEKENMSLVSYIQSILSIPLDDEQELLEYIATTLSFIEFYEKKKKDTLLSVQKLWHSKMNDKEKMLIGLEIMIACYQEVLFYQLNQEVTVFSDYQDLIIEIAKQNSYQMMIQKINILMEMKSRMQYNVNQALLMDTLILKMEGVNL